MSILGVDLSHFQGTPDFAAVKASGRAFVVLKATEGTDYTDPVFQTNRRSAHAAGLIVLIYHFGRGLSPVAEADYFLSVVGPLAVGEGLVLDDEVAAITPAWAKSWCDEVFARTTVKPLVYLNQNVQNTQDWSGLVADNDGEWLAKYDGNLTQPTGGAWGAPAMKQYSDAGSVAGIAGGVDLDVFYGTPAQLAAYGLGGSPPPTVQEDDMRLIRNQDTGGVYVAGEFSMSLIPTPAIWDDYKAAGYTATDVPDAVFQQLQADAGARRAGLLTDVSRWVLCRTPDPCAKDGDAYYGVPWLYDMVRTIDGKVGQPQATVDAAAVGAALAASPGFVQAVVAGVVAGIDGDLAKRFGPTT